jgi:hypothetical protein
MAALSQPRPFAAPNGIKAERQLQGAAIWLTNGDDRAHRCRADFGKSWPKRRLTTFASKSGKAVNLPQHFQIETIFPWCKSVDVAISQQSSHPERTSNRPIVHVVSIDHLMTV